MSTLGSAVFRAINQERKRKPPGSLNTSSRPLQSEPRPLQHAGPESGHEHEHENSFDSSQTTARRESDRKRTKSAPQGAAQIKPRDTTAVQQDLQAFFRSKLSPSHQIHIRSDILAKFFRRRYSLFSRFDSGILLDYESWFSVTPEVLAIHTAERLRCEYILDAFCGAGGAAIQLANTCERVVCVDIDPTKVALARHNAGVYDVADRMEFVCGDFLDIARGFSVSRERNGKVDIPPASSASSLTAATAAPAPSAHRKAGFTVDVVFLAPPWGGPEYSENDVFDLRHMSADLDGYQVFAAAREITENICMQLPKTTHLDDLVQMMRATGGLLPLEVEENWLNGALISLTCYFGNILPMDDEQSMTDERYRTGV